MLFVLGAGASVPLGMPTTFQLRQQLCDETPDGRFAVEIHASAAYRYRIGADSVNIELFLEHVYELQLMLWLAQRSSLPQMLPHMTANAPLLDSAGEVLARIQRRAYQLLHDLCGDCSGKQAHVLWSPVLRLLGKYQPAVPIFTLNYDWTFEKLAIEAMDRYQLIDGFELLGGKWDAGRFHAPPAPHGKTSIALFKLHGSTNWLGEGPVKSMGHFEPMDNRNDDGLPPHQFEMIYPGHAHEMWFGKEAWHELSDPRGMFEAWPDREPYKTLHHHFERMAKHAALLVVIGYAFGDERVNNVLTASHNAKVLVVDPGVEQYVKASDTRYRMPPYHFLMHGSEVDWSRFEWIEGGFGDAHVARELGKAFRTVK